MTEQTTIAQHIEQIAQQCGVDALTVQLAAEGVTRRLVALFGGAEQAAAGINGETVEAALLHYTNAMQQLGEQALADPSQIITQVYQQLRQ